MEREGREGDQLTFNLERIHEDFARITSDNVDPGGLIDIQLRKVEGGEGGRGEEGRGDGRGRESGSINGQLGKNLQRLCKDYL